jgi:hypothetical protein
VSGSTLQPGDVQVAPDVLAWSPQRGPITAPADLAAAVREEQIVLCASTDHVVHAGTDVAPMSVVVRVDDDIAALARQLTDLVAEVDALRLRLLDIVESAAAALSDA